MENSTQQHDANGGTPLAEPTGSRPDWMSDEAYVIGYAAEHLDAVGAPTGRCFGCDHYRCGNDSCAPAEGDWCHLCAGIGGEGRWGECPALISANTSLHGRTPAQGGQNG